MAGKWWNDVPFPRHRKYYIALKFAVLIAAVILVLKLFNVF